jgi:hypothetical protein
VAEKGFAGSMVGLALDIFVPVAMAPELRPFGLRINLLEERGTHWLFRTKTCPSLTTS